MAVSAPSESPKSGLHGSPAQIRTAAILVTTLFFFWGIVNNSLPAVVAKVREACDLTTFQASLLASAFWLAYFFMPIMAGVVMRRKGYKGAIVVGLALGAIGCAIFAGAASLVSYALFLVAPFVAASGMAFLESAANPYISILGAPERAPNRLNFAQAFNGLAGFVGALWGTKLILGDVKHGDKELRLLNPAYYHALDENATAVAAKLPAPHDFGQLATIKHAVPEFVGALNENARAVTPVFVCAAIAFALVTAAFIFVKLPDTKEHEKNHSEIEEEKSVLKELVANKYFLFGVFALFCYVGAQEGVKDFFLIYVPEVTGLPKGDAGTYLGLILGCFMLGRVVGTSLMTKISARVLLGAFAAINIALLLWCGFATKSHAAMHAYDIPAWLGLGDKLVLTSHPAPYVLMGVKFFMSIMFPTIFSLALTGLGKATKTGATILIMAIVGGAVFSPIMGLISDHLGNIAPAYLVPMACTIPILLFAFAKPKAA